MKFKKVTMEQELTEFTILQIAIERIENRPTTAQRAMAIVPFLLIIPISHGATYRTKNLLPFLPPFYQ
jgi:hypothetical protein